MDAVNTNGRKSSVSLTRPSVDGDWRVRGGGSDAYKSSLLYAASHHDPARVSFADDREREQFSRRASIQSNSTKYSEEEGAAQSGRDALDPKLTSSEHAAMNAKRMSMDPAPYDFNDPMFSTDEFRVWEMKIRNCPKSRPHDWTCCPFAHPGEKAKRRDPRLFSYCGTACADYRKSGSCARGDSCMYAHGVFECWLHPSRYRTQLCTDGEACARRVCFFAHRECELRKPVGGHMAAIPQPGVNSLDCLGIGGNGVVNRNSMGQPEMLGEAQQRTSMGAAPMGTHGPPQPQIRASESNSFSLSAAIQMLDPVSKHRLLEALQNDLHETASQSSFFNSQDALHADNKSSERVNSESVMNAIQQLRLGTRMSRHSLDEIAPILSGQGGGRHASGLPPYNNTHQYLSSITSSRKSVDIGAVSRMASGANGFSTDFHSRQVPVAHLSGAALHGAPAVRSSMDGLMRSAPRRDAVNLGGLYESSIPALNSIQLPGTKHGDGRNRSHDEDPRMVLGKILENPQWETSEGTGSGGSSSVAGFCRSSSEGSNLGIQMGNNGSHSGASKPSSKGFQREFSVDNLLAELPRSASEVDLMSHQ